MPSRLEVEMAETLRAFMPSLDARPHGELGH